MFLSVGPAKAEPVFFAAVQTHFDPSVSQPQIVSDLNSQQWVKSAWMKCDEEPKEVKSSSL